MKIAVISGASSGLGIEFLRAAVTLCPEIVTYWLIARREDRLEALKPQFPGKNLRPIALDLTDSAALKQFNALLEREKPEISLLINNAGFGKLCNFATSDVESQTAMIDLNCRALTAVTRYSLPYMKTGGLILNISSIASFAPTPRMAVYCSTKAYVQSFSRALREELKLKKINVLAVCPGPMITEFWQVADRPAHKSRTLDILPHQSPAKMATCALKAGLKGKSACTMGGFYKFYRFLAHILPKSLLMKWTKC